MNIAIVGTGYVGLVTGTCFAETGNSVTCIDVNELKIKQLEQGLLPIYEPGLDLLVERNIMEKRLHFTTSLKDGIRNARVVFLALPTPPGKEGCADLQYIMEATESLGKLISHYTVIVIKSTVPIGTAHKINDALAQHINPSLFNVVANPEFLREGVAVDDFLKPDRVIIGTSSEKAKKVMDELYQPYLRQGNPIYFMDECSAEMTKYAANSFLAMRISFMNEIANLCEKTGANVDWVRIGIGGDSRIGKRFLFPGIGYGGSCFPKDVKALAHTASATGYDFQLIRTIIDVNEKQKLVLGKKVRNYFGPDLSLLTLAIWGLAFKPETDDIRDAPSLQIVNELTEAGAKLRVFDPVAMNNVRRQIGDHVYYAANQYDAIKGASAIIIITEWSEFRNPDFDRIHDLLEHPAIFDGRNVYSLDKMNDLGFYYESIGRAVVNPHIHARLRIPEVNRIEEVLE